MKNTFGSAVSMTIFGESHGPAIGAVLDGLAAGLPVDPDFLAVRMDRRRAAYYKYYTGQEWGQPANYHLCVDSGVLGLSTADVLAAFVQLAEQNKTEGAK